MRPAAPARVPFRIPPERTGPPLPEVGQPGQCRGPGPARTGEARPQRNRGPGRGSARPSGPHRPMAGGQPPFDASNEPGAAIAPATAQTTAVTTISTFQAGLASLASTVARAGALPGTTQASQARFMPSKSAMSAR